MRTSMQAAMAAINLYSEYFLGLIVSITIARSLSTNDYGVYSSILWLAGLITLAVNAGLSLNVIKFVAEFKKKEESALPAIIAYFSYIQRIRIVIVTIVACLVLAYTYGNTRMEVWLLVTLFVCATIKADYMFRIAIFKGIKRYDVVAKTSLLANPFNIIAVLLCAYFDATLESFILVYCSACLIYGASSRFFNSELPEKKWNESVIDAHKKRILFQMLSATGIVFCGALIFRQSQVIFLEHNNLLSEAGYFNIAFLLSSAAMTLIPGIYQEILLPKITDAIQNGDVKTQVEQAERYLITLSLLVAIPVVLYADVIINVLYGERYQGAVFSLQVMIILKAIMILNQGANLTLISNDKQIGMVKIYAVMFIITVVLSLLCVPYLGLNGALTVYGVLVFILLISYSYLAKSCNYKMLPIQDLLRIILPAIISCLPVIIINYFLSGIIAAIIGSLIYAIVYFNLLFIFKGYDKSVIVILKQIKPKAPFVMRKYIEWGINRLI